MRTSTPRETPNRPFVEWLGIALALFVGVITGGCAPLLVPAKWPGTGPGAGVATPFTSFVMPGIVLALVGIVLVIAGIRLLRRTAWGIDASLMAGGMLLGWIVIETSWIDAGRELQVAIIAAALGVILGSLSLRRRRRLA